jgi:hypothetical protein
MRYYLIFALYQKDDGDMWTAKHFIQRDYFPKIKDLTEYCEIKTFSKLIGITGIIELNALDYNYLMNES